MKTSLFTLVLLVGMLLSGCVQIERTNGRSVAGITLGRSAAADVLTRMGTPDSVAKHGTYSVEMIYSRMGLSFYYLREDPGKIIFDIRVTAPYRLQTYKGITLDKSTMLDVRNAYGKLNWETADGSDYWFSDYDGIGYGVLRNRTVPQYPLNEKLHMNLKITEINLDDRYRK